MLERVWGCRLATYRSYGACWSEFGDVGWQPTGLMEHVGASLGMSYGNLQVSWACWSEFGAVGWQPTGLMGQNGANLGMYFGNLQVLWCMLEQIWGCRLATYRSCGACWSEFGAIGWQPTGLMGHVGASLGLYFGNLQVLWGMLERV